MTIFAATTAQPTLLDRLGLIPTQFWVQLGIWVAIVIGTVVVLRKLAKVNKVILAIVSMLAVSIIGFNWIYERNEPTWATPVVRWLAGFFPSKGAV